ncbi:hypothetical protein Tco_1334799 [Tanacetum coccineum]
MNNTICQLSLNHHKPCIVAAIESSRSIRVSVSKIERKGYTFTRINDDCYFHVLDLLKWICWYDIEAVDVKGVVMMDVVTVDVVDVVKMWWV